MEPPKKVAERESATLFSSLRKIQHTQLPIELLAGVTLLAIALPEQLATAQLAQVSSFIAVLAFVAATIVFAMFGSNPVLSVGADSTIAPLFAVALVRLAAPNTPHFLALVAATAIGAGLLIAMVGLFKLGWLADFLSAPIVTGFMVGIGLTIMVHQLPHALGLRDVSGTFLHRLATIGSHVSSTNAWCAVIAFGTLAVVVGGERLSKRVPFTLVAIIGATILTAAASLRSHGVSTLGKVALVAPQWRLRGFTWHELAIVATTASTVALVILSQSAATARGVADEMCVDDDINRDFVALGLSNVVTGLIGAIPVNASPARTGVVRAASGRTQLVGLVAALGTFVVIPLAPVMKDLPLAALAGVLFYVAGRLIKVRSLRQIARVDRYELALAIVTALAVILIGVQEGIAVAVLLAIIDQTRRSARPRAIVLGRRPNSTSWEQIGREGAQPVDHATVLLFTAPLYFANAALFRTEVHAALRDYPDATHLIVDAAAISDIDFTGLEALGAIVSDLDREKVTVVLARANDRVLHALSRAPSKLLRTTMNYGTVDEAVSSVAG